jgi:putative hydrolase of the HAD superfamily
MFRNVLFDLGGVLIDLDVQRTISAFCRLLPPQEEGASSSTSLVTAQGLLGGHDSELIDRYQTGDISTADFIRTILSVCRPGTTEEQVRDAWFAMLLGIPEENKQLLRDIHAAGYNIYVLSNINEMHVDWVHDYCPELRAARHCFFSNEMHLSKPDTRCYEQVISEAGIRPDETLYVDDLFPNIEEGRRHGFRCIHATDTSWRNTLRQLLNLDPEK